MKCDDIEVYLTGYLDGELTQQQRQRVRVHIETCPRCEATLEELREARDATGRLELERPSNQEWELIMSSILENRTQHLGWLILIIWAAALAAYGLYGLAVAPDEPLIGKVLVFGLLAGLALLFVSVLARRVREGRTDRYKEVVK